jgi:hypothetical protein
MSLLVNYGISSSQITGPKPLVLFANGVLHPSYNIGSYQELSGINSGLQLTGGQLRAFSCTGDYCTGGGGFLPQIDLTPYSEIKVTVASISGSGGSDRIVTFGVATALSAYPTFIDDYFLQRTLVGTSQPSTTLSVGENTINISSLNGFYYLATRAISFNPGGTAAEFSISKIELIL